MRQHAAAVRRVRIVRPVGEGDASPTVNACAARYRAARLAAAPVWTRTPLKSRPNRTSNQARVAKSSGWPAAPAVGRAARGGALAAAAACITWSAVPSTSRSSASLAGASGSDGAGGADDVEVPGCPHMGRPIACGTGHAARRRRFRAVYPIQHTPASGASCESPPRRRGARTAAEPRASNRLVCNFAGNVIAPAADAAI